MGTDLILTYYQMVRSPGTGLAFRFRFLFYQIGTFGGQSRRKSRPFFLLGLSLAAGVKFEYKRVDLYEDGRQQAKGHVVSSLPSGGRIKGSKTLLRFNEAEKNRGIFRSPEAKA